MLGEPVSQLVKSLSERFHSQPCSHNYPRRIGVTPPVQARLVSSLVHILGVSDSPVSLGIHIVSSTTSLEGVGSPLGPSQLLCEDLSWEKAFSMIRLISGEKMQPESRRLQLVCGCVQIAIQNTYCLYTPMTTLFAHLNLINVCIGQSNIAFIKSRFIQKPFTILKAQKKKGN